MHATLRQSGTTDAVRGIRGTFYPGDGAADGRSVGSAVAKVGIVLVALAVVRNVIAHAGGRHGGSGMSRRRQMIAELHRELHADEAATPEPPAKA